VQVLLQITINNKRKKTLINVSIKAKAEKQSIDNIIGKPCSYRIWNTLQYLFITM